MNPLPRLLETYAEARMLLEAKGWPLAAAAEHLTEMPGLKRYHISQAKISKRTTPGSKFPIEPEIAAAVEEMETRIGYERQTEIVTAGLLAAHGDRPAAEVPAGQRVSRFLRTLAVRLGRASWRPILITAGSGALVGCLALLLLAPLLPARANAAQPGPLVVIVADAGPDGSPVRFEPGSLLAMYEWGEKVPADQPIPVKLLPGQKAPPCDSELREEAINAGCWAWMGGEPPCGRLFRHGNKCYRPVASDAKKPVGPTP